MDIQKIKYNQELLKNKARLHKELGMINQEREHEQLTCEHIPIVLGEGYSELPPHKNTYISCMICGKESFNLSIDISKIESKFIDARYYKKEKYNTGQLKSYRDEKLHEIQDLYIQYSEETPNMTREELIEKINETIKKENEQTNNQEEKLL